MNEGYLPIGRFARLCRLSVKQLRNYDELGLLTPAHVDPDTGYRYYRPDQARTALTIGLLRSLDVPLPSIGRVLAGEPEALGGVRDRMEAELARTRRNFAALERIVSDGLPRAEVTVVREAAKRVAIVRDIASPERIGSVTSACVARLIAAVGEPKGPLIGLFPLDITQEVAVAVAMETSSDVPGTFSDVPRTFSNVPGISSDVPRTSSDVSKTFADVPGTSSDILPGGLFASATHVGPYDQVALTAHPLLAWVSERGHTPCGPLREVYVTDPTTTSPDRLVTHLMIQLEDPR
ncbi:MerR family transcriptional regulator [Streptosporangium sp. KLBMP 9127]|nr:MerR family transcriptional regulator [Streptosporangium sp. KLBMP 9127]